jgi:serine protease Do
VLNDLGARVPAAAVHRIAEYVAAPKSFADLAAFEAHLREVHAPFGVATDAGWRHMAETSHRIAADGTVVPHYDPAIAVPFANATDHAIDLGFDVVQIPAKRVLDVKRQEEAGGQAAAAETDRGIFRTGRLEAREVPDLVRRFGDAVMMIRSAGGLGTGFLVSREGHVVTNYHVVEKNTRLQATLYRRVQAADGRTSFEKTECRTVKIVALQPLRDLAILQLDPAEPKGGLPEPVVINDRDDLRVGDLVFAIGNPAGLERSVTQGIVSSTTRTIDQVRLIQTDASINPGNSGGPIFNARGEVVAVVCAGASVFQGLAFGIPANELIDFLVHRDTYLYDESQPQNGVTYLQPPFRRADAAAPPGTAGERP